MLISLSSVHVSFSSCVFVPLPLPVSIPFEKQLNFIHRTLQVAPMLMSAICYCVYSNVVSIHGELHSESIDIVIGMKKKYKEKVPRKEKKGVRRFFVVEYRIQVLT